MDDARLVAEALAGDRDAYAAIYDRYADRVHDFCASLLRNRAAAGDALQETFLVAFESLDRLAQPARLGVWLYTIAHRSVLDRLRDGVTPSGNDDESDLRWGSGAPDERLSRAELAEFVWQTSAGLPEPDRALLDLHLRQGFEGNDLARATGLAAAELGPRLERLESQVERALGALLVARTSRRGCPEVYGLVNGWDGRLTPEFRDQVTAHCNDCEVCNSRRRILLNPLVLLAAAPIGPAPAYLRSVVLGKAELDRLEREGGTPPLRVLASAGWTFDNHGFPNLSEDMGLRQGTSGGSASATAVEERSVSATPPTATPTTVAPTTVAPTTVARATYMAPADQAGPRGGDRDRRGMLVGALAGLIVLIAGTVILLSNHTKTSSGTVGITVTTTAATATTVPRTTTPFTAATVAPTLPPSTVASAGHLIVGGSKSLDLGATASSASLIVGNDGPAPVDFTATAAGAGLTVTPATGSLASGASQTLTVALDRASGSPGPFTGSILIVSPGGSTTVPVTAVVDPGPTITGETQKPALVYTGKCPSRPATTSLITAAVAGPLPLKVVVLHWQGSGVVGPGGSAMGSTAMTVTGTGSDTSATYSAPLGPFSVASTAPTSTTTGPTGTVDWWISAIDNANATSASMHHSLAVTC